MAGRSKEDPKYQAIEVCGCFTVLYFALYKTVQDYSEEDGQVELCRKEVRSTAKEFGQDRRLL